MKIIAEFVNGKISTANENFVLSKIPAYSAIYLHRMP